MIKTRVLCCGDRNWQNFEIIRRELEKFPKDTKIIQGCANGADKMSANIAKSLGLKLISASDNDDYINNPGFPANWDKYRKLGYVKAAGPKRNTQMLDEGKPDLVLAFHNDIENSKGTKNMIEQAKKRGIKVILIKE